MGLLTEPEIAGLPEEMRGWYRSNEGLRARADLVWFPPAKRASLECLAERGDTKAVERIRAQEGDRAADAAARELKAARLDRAAQVAKQERRAS